MESLISAAIAVVTGGFVLTSRINGQIAALDRRLDEAELRIATTYLSKSDFQIVVSKLETSMNRVEEKVDRILSSQRFS